MADRYWVGGSGLVGNTAKWSTTSGGAGGASLPTAADDVYIDGNSDAGSAFSVTISSTLTCRNLIIGDGVTVSTLDQNCTLENSGAVNIYGSLFFPTTLLTQSATGTFSFLATTSGNTVTPNGKGFMNAAFNGVGGVWTLGSAFIVGGDNTTIYAGTVNTGNFNITTFNFRHFGGTFNAGSSTITSSNTFNINGGVFNAGTSIISLIAPGGSTFQFIGSGGTFNEVRVPESATFGNSVLDVSGANTFATFRVLPHTSILSCRLIRFSADQTITGTFSVKSGVTSFTDRVLFGSSVRGTPRTITAAALDFGNGADFTDITAAGAAAPWNLAGVSTGDGGGNTNITFPAPKTVYWNLAGSQSWISNGWATTPTGTPAAANFPLVHDTAVVTEAGAAGTIAFIGPTTIGNLTFDNGVSPRTSTVTIANNLVNRFLWILGDLKLSSGVVFTTTGGVNYNFSGTGNKTITSANKVFVNDVSIGTAVGSSLVLQDNMSVGTRTFFLGAGTVDLNNKILSATGFNSNNSNVRSIAFGTSGKIELAGNSSLVVNAASAVNFSYTGTSNVELTYAGSTGDRIIDFGTANPSGATEANALNFTISAGFDRVISFTSNFLSSVRNLTFTDSFSGVFNGPGNNNYRNFPVCYGNVRLSPTMTFGTDAGTLPFNFAGTTGTQQFTSSGRTFPRGVTKSGASTLRLMDNLTLASGMGVSHSAGTVDLNNKVLTAASYSTGSGSVRSLVFGTGELVLTGASGVLWDAANATLLTVVPGSGKIFITDTSASGKNFDGGGIQTYPEVVIQGGASTSMITIIGANRFERITNARTSAYTIVFPNATTTFNSWGLNGTEGNLVTLARTGGTGGFIISYAPAGTMIAQFVSISNSTFLPSGKGYAVKSVNGGSNFGWIFGAPAFGKFLSFFSTD